MHVKRLKLQKNVCKLFDYPSAEKLDNYTAALVICNRSTRRKTRLATNWRPTTREMEVKVALLPLCKKVASNVER